MHIDAHAAAVDLADANVHELEDGWGQIGDFGRFGQRLEGF
jgi:hypothetical protein